MKKVYLGLLVSTVLFGANLAHATTTLPGADVQFRGYVLPTSCDIVLDGAAGQTVTLPTTQDSDFNAVDGHSNKTKQFTIKLSRCPDSADLVNFTEPDVVRKVNWVVTGSQWIARPGSSELSLIANTGGPAAASNTALYLMAGANESPTGQVTASNPKFQAIPGTSDNYPFIVGYTRIANAFPAGTGTVTGSATFNILYE